MKSRTLTMLLLPLLATACGGDHSGPSVVTTPPPTTLAPVATPTPTPTPAPTHAGTYVGTMAFSLSGVPAGSFPARLEVTQDGQTLDLGTLELPGSGGFPLKTATMTSANEFEGSAGYGSVGCGRVKVSTSGSFSGDNMHLNAGLTSDCIHAKLSGDLGR